MKTILITGCSSGFGLETVKLFLERGWKVIATMRTPRADLLPASENLRILPLDVTREDSVQKLAAAAGPIDALVNNAGIGLLAAVEGASMEAIRETFETNTFGTIAMIKAFLPQFRERKSGVIVNVTSSVTMKSLPLLSVYTASKAAVNAFTESFALELEPFNIRVRLVLPGRSPETSFSKNARGRPVPMHAAYAPLAEKIFAGWAQSPGSVTSSSDVAEAVWFAITDSSSPMRIPAGADAVELSKTH